MEKQNATTTKQEPALVGNPPNQTLSEIVAETISHSGPMLIGIEPCLKIVFPDKETRPGIRTFNEWKNRGYFPSVKIGKRVFLDPAQVRKALDKRFTIDAISA